MINKRLTDIKDDFDFSTTMLFQYCQREWKCNGGQKANWLDLNDQNNY